jgi:hypothetical protein
MSRKIRSPPRSPSSRSSLSSSSSRDELLSVKMQRTDSTRSLRASKGKTNEEVSVDIVPARPSQDDGNLSLDDLFDPSKTAKENKSTLMSYELDRMGMGRYQWCVFILCGLGFFIDLLWAQAFGLILVPLKNQPGFNATSTSLLRAMHSQTLVADTHTHPLSLQTTTLACFRLHSTSV